MQDWTDCPECGGDGVAEYFFGRMHEPDVRTERCERCKGECWVHICKCGEPCWGDSTICKECE